MHDEEIRTEFGDGLHPKKVDENRPNSCDGGVIARHAPRDHPGRAWDWSRRREIEPVFVPGRTTEESIPGLSLTQRMKDMGFSFWRGSGRAPTRRESELDLLAKDEGVEAF